MSRNRAFVRGASAYRRERPRIPSSGKAFLIVTEGEKTEPNYLKALRDRLHLNATDVEVIHPEGTDPVTLIKKAIELRDARKKDAKKGKGFVVPYDEVWVVFDLERTHDVRRTLAINAKGRKEAKSIWFADSDPCFEFWLLLHYEYTTRPFEDCDSVVKHLEKEHWSDYSKAQTPPQSLLDKLPLAVANAQKCREYHKTSGGDCNPSTNIDLLVKNLNLAARGPYQFSLT